MQETVRNLFGYDEEFVNPTSGPFTEDDLKISEADVKGFVKRNKDAPKGLVNQMLFDMANPQYTRYGESKTLTGLGTKSSLEAVKDQLIAEALSIDAQKKASKKAATVPAEYGLMSPKNVMASVNNNLNRSGILMPLGMDSAKAPAIGTADKPTDPKTLTGPITGTDVLKSLNPFDSSVGKLRYETGQILSRLPALEVVGGGPGGATVASGMRINLKGLANLGEEFLTQSLLAKIKKGGTELGGEFVETYIKAKGIDPKKLPQNNQVIKQLGNNQKNVPVLKVKELGVAEDLKNLDISPTPKKTIDDTSLVEAYTGQYREGYGHGEKKAVDSFIISDSATSVGLKAKDVKTPYTGFRQYEHPQVVGDEYKKEPLYGHVRTIDLKRLAGGDIHPNIDVEARVLGQKNEFLSPSYGIKDFDYFEKRGFWNPEVQIVTKFEDSSKAIRDVSINKDVNKELNNFGIDKKNMITEIEPEAIVKSDFSGYDTDKVNILKNLLDMRIRMQRLHALVRFLDIPKLEVLQKNVPLTQSNISKKAPVPLDKDLPFPNEEQVVQMKVPGQQSMKFFGEKISALPKTAFYNFDDVLNKIKSEKNLDKLIELENYILNYTKSSIKNSLTTDAKRGSPNVLSDIWLTSIRTNTGTTPGDYYYTRRNDVTQGMVQNRFNGPLLMDHPHFRNPLSHKVIYGIMGQLSEIYAQKNVFNFDLRNPVGTSINLRDAQINLLEAIPSGAKIPYSTALKNLIKHEELGGENLYNLYKKATLSNKEIETMSSSGEAITTRRADGFVPTAGKLRNDIQTAEKKWGKGENILRFSEEQYDTFSPSNFRTADDMLEAMGKKGAVLDFDFNVPDIAFANFRNRPEHLVELTTLHNIKKAIENNYDVVQFNTFNTQAKLSGWSESLFEGRRGAMTDYFLSGFTGDKALNANDKALLTIINNSIDEKVLQSIKSTKGHERYNEGLTGDANVFRHSETNYDALRKLPKTLQSRYLKAVKKAMDEKDIDGKVINALKGVSDDVFVDVFDSTSYLIRILESVPLQPKYKDLPLIKLLNKAGQQNKFISGALTAGTVTASKVNANFKKEVINEIFSPRTAKAVTPTEVKYTGILGGLSNKLSGKLDEFGILLYHIKQKILKNSFAIEMGNTPTNENIAKKNMDKVFHKKYKGSFPTEEALTKAIVGKTNDKGNSIYAALNKQYGKDKMKALEKFGLQPKIITDTKNNVTRSFIEINLGKTKKEKLDLLERLNNYEVKLYSRVNPVPTFNEVAEEELVTEAENKTAVPAFM